MTDDKLADLERLANAATKAPWFKREETCEAGPLTDQHIALVGSNATSADLNFVCAARSAVPELIAEVRRLQAEREGVVCIGNDGFWGRACPRVQLQLNAAVAELAALRQVADIASGILELDVSGRHRLTEIQDALADAIEAAQAAKGGTRG